MTPAGLARSALVALGRPRARLRLLLDGYNTTWRVDDADGRFALRLTRPGPSVEHVAAEVAWMRALAEHGGVRVTVPEGFVGVEGRALLLTRWLPGRLVWTRRMPPHQHALGVAMARLHAQAEGWTPPTGWARPRLDDVWLGEPSPLPRLDARAHDAFAAAAERVQPLLHALVAERCHVVHGDLHPWNVKHDAALGIGVLDFDDSAVGHPAQDVAIGAFYLGAHPRKAALLEAFEAGYRTVRPWPMRPGWLEALRVWRVLSLCASVHAHPSPAMTALIPKRMPGWTDRVEAWLSAP